MIPVSILGYKTEISDFAGFVIFSTLNLLIFIDRGVIPGSTVEFNGFILSTTGYEQSDVLLGLLQSSFVIGLVSGALLFGHLSHTYGAFYLTGVGVLVWAIAVLLSGLSFYSHSYAFLLFARIFSGLGEASLLCNIPPWIQSSAPAGRQGIWLGIFYTAIPVGTAFGYAYSAAVSTSIGWSFAFFFEAFVTIPFLFALFSMVDNRSGEDDRQQLLTNKNKGSSTSAPHGRKISIWEEIQEVLSSPVYVCLCFASTAQAAVLIGLSTFGSALLLGLGYFGTESEASTIFGVLISIAGVVATPLGGFVVDKLQHSRSVEINLEKIKGHNKSNNNQTSENMDAVVPVVGDFEPVIYSTSGKSDRTIIKEYPSHEDMKIIEQACMFMYWASWCSSLLFCLSVFCTSAWSMLLLMTVASSFCFSTNAGVALGQIASVPKQYQSFALAMASLILHALGDVPSPLVAGYLKDVLAPACVGQTTELNETNPASSVECRAQGSGQRWFMLWISLWLFWSVAWFGCAWWLSNYYANELETGNLRYMQWGDIFPILNTSRTKITKNSNKHKNKSSSFS